MSGNGPNDGLETRAAADIACQRVPDFGIGRVGFVTQEPLGSYQHPRHAIAALHSTHLQEGILQAAASAEPFYCNDFAPGGLERQHQARIDRPAIQQHGAGSALAFATAFLDTGQAKNIAQEAA
jgi:hypothetical protein